MNYYALQGFDDFPEHQNIENPEMGFGYDYTFEGASLGKNRIAELSITTTIIDHSGQRFIRKSKQLIPRIEVKNCIAFRIKEHLLYVGIDADQVGSIMRNFVVDTTKGKATARY